MSFTYSCLFGANWDATRSVIRVYLLCGIEEISSTSPTVICGSLAIWTATEDMSMP